MSTRTIITILLLCLFSCPSPAAENSKTASLEMGRKQFESGNFERALDLFAQAIQSTSDANIRNRALYYQGLTYFEMGLYYSSYLSFRSVLMAPDERFKEVYEKAIKNSVTIADRLDLVDKIGGVIVKLDNRTIPTTVSSMARYAKGLFYLNTNRDSEAESELKSVSPESNFYPKAVFHLGVIATKKKNYREAMAYFEKTVALCRGKKEWYSLEELARLNLARSAYSGNEIERSVELYSKFLSSSPYWLDVLMEASWPLLKINDTTVSLGNLHTILSPFYQQDLVGEAYVLRATLLHRLCKYEEMRKDLAAFFTTYDPIIRAMEKEIASLGGPEAYYRAYKDKKGLNRGIINVLNRDQGVQKNIKILDLLNEERRELARVPKNEQTSRMVAQVEALKENLSRETGQVIKNIHKRKFSELLQQRDQANYLKVEVVTGEKDLIESQKGLPPKRVVDVSTTVAPGYQFWPYNGEYWEDELGTYIYTTENSCVN